jgi:hypothetical protein
MSEQAYDAIMDDMLTEMRTLFDAGLVAERVGTDFSSEERFITLSKHLAEMATSRSDTKAIRRGGRNAISMRDVVFAQRKEKFDAEKAVKRQNE